MMFAGKNFEHWQKFNIEIFVMAWSSY